MHRLLLRMSDEHRPDTMSIYPDTRLYNRPLKINTIRFQR
jgi:hypothetical protein